MLNLELGILWHKRKTTHLPPTSCLELVSLSLLPPQNVLSHCGPAPAFHTPPPAWRTGDRVWRSWALSRGVPVPSLVPLKMGQGSMVSPQPPAVGDPITWKGPLAFLQSPGGERHGHPRSCLTWSLGRRCGHHPRGRWWKAHGLKVACHHSHSGHHHHSDATDLRRHSD